MVYVDKFLQGVFPVEAPFQESDIPEILRLYKTGELKELNFSLPVDEKLRRLMWKKLSKTSIIFSLECPENCILDKTDLQSIAQIKYLKELTFEKSQPLVFWKSLNTEIFPAHPKLKVKVFFDMKKDEYQNWIKAISNVQHLTIKNNSIADILPFVLKLTQLKSLVLENHYGKNEILSLEPLAQLRQLQYLCLKDFKITDQLPYIEKLPLLKKLSIVFPQGIITKKDYTSISRLENLEYLELRFFKEKKVPLDILTEGLKSTKELYFEMADLQALSSLSKLPILEKITFRYRPSDFSGLKDCKQLKHLVIKDNGVIEKLDFLSEMSALKSIYLSGKQGAKKISNLPSLIKLKNCEKVTLSGLDGIQDFSPLIDLKELKILTLLRDKVSLQYWTKLLARMTRLKIFYFCSESTRKIFYSDKEWDSFESDMKKMGIRVDEQAILEMDQKEALEKNDNFFI